MLVETANPWSCDCKDHFCLKQLMPCSLRCIWPWFGPLIPHRITLADIQAKSSDFICNANSILVQVFFFLFLKRFAIWIVFHHGCSTDQYSHLIANTGISYKFICKRIWYLAPQTHTIITVICCLACKLSPLCSVCIACYKTSMF